MTNWIEQLNFSKTLKWNNDIFSPNNINDFILKFNNTINFDENWALTEKWLEQLDKINSEFNNNEIYKKISRDFKSGINIEKYRKNNKNKELTEKDIILNKWIEAEYSYINQNKFWEKLNQKKENKLDEKKEITKEDLNTFSKMNLLNMYETFEWNKKKKKEFVLNLINNKDELFKNEYFAIIIKDLNTKIPYYSANQYASNWLTPYNKIDVNKTENDINIFLTKIWNAIKSFLETWIRVWYNISDLVKKSFENWEEKEKELIVDFDKKYEVLSKWLKTSEDTKTWFSWSIIKEKWSNNKTLLIRWSDDFKDWIDNNTHIAMKDKLPPQVESVILFIEEAKAKWIIKTWEELNIVWHSLGWWLAQIISIMYKDEFKNLKTYTFNSPWVAWIEANINSDNKIVNEKVDYYKNNLSKFKNNNFVLNIRNNDIVWNLDDDNHIWMKTWKIDWYSHFLDSLNLSIKEMSIEEFNKKFRMWIKDFKDEE